MTSAQIMATQRVPAWKRLGLKLRSAEPQAETLSTPSAPQRPDAAFQSSHTFDSPKRKRDQFGDAAAARPLLKKPKQDTRPTDTTLRRQKSVSFAEVTASAKKTNSEQKKAKAAPKKKKSPKTPKPEAAASPPDLTGPLEYLRLWKTSRTSWKFNKNHQAHLISHAFDLTLFPSADIGTFYEYIRELKGYARTRLLETAKIICTEDMDDGRDHFPAGTADVESKKKQYEEIMSNILRRSQAEPKRKFFNELDYTTSRDVHPEVAHRLAKRMRAEVVSEELSNESDGAEEAGESTVSSTTDKEQTPPNEASGEPDAGKRLKLNDGTTRPIKRVRASKRRGADLDDSSSESSDSDSDDDSDASDDSSSGSGSSDDSSSDSSDDSDDEMDVDSRPDDQDTSSSSSSSSDEDEDEDEDSDSDGE